MRVKETHFIDLIPGQPIYEMENGELRIPLLDGNTKGLIWCTEKEALKAIVNPNEEHEKFIKTHFKAVKIAIETAVGGKMRKIIN